MASQIYFLSFYIEQDTNFYDLFAGTKHDEDNIGGTSTASISLPIQRDIDPEANVIHIGTNDLLADKTPDEICSEILQLIKGFKTY